MPPSRIIGWKGRLDGGWSKVGVAGSPWRRHKAAVWAGGRRLGHNKDKEAVPRILMEAAVLLWQESFKAKQMNQHDICI